MAECGTGQDLRIPVTVVTGYLGAGKTTLVNHLIARRGGKRLAVIVNEFGEIGVDGDIIETGGEELIELSSGCLCCVVRGDLIRTLRNLLKRRDELDLIIIETTGVANPSPVIQTFMADQVLVGRCRLDSVVTVVDAHNVRKRLADSKDAADQIALSSLIVLNKSDDASDLDEIEEALRALNRFAPIHRVERGKIAPSAVLDTHSLDLDRIEDQLAPDDAHDHDHVADSGIASVTLTGDGPIDAVKLEDWLRNLLAVSGEDILRTKGIIAAAGEDRKLVIQAVNMSIEGDRGSTWGENEERRSRLVFIGRNLDAPTLRAGFLACMANSGT